ncbi:unnamed protein product [Zymoseptoria tritici ST99CH_1E4]|uniref:Uncharacterized protein n=1 Tax=Zymoseptoria tritici ST99CH_1E4 TaxID=1276532 RepID=A0A2H1FYE0_ZYMTR|nr:unnamed protein product [Zymoseptoria tritici ST99CH_1E4]
MDTMEAALTEKVTQLEQALRDAEEVEEAARAEAERSETHLRAMIRKSKFEVNFKAYDLVSAEIEAEEGKSGWFDSQAEVREAHALLMCVEYELQLYRAGFASPFQNARKRTKQTLEASKAAWEKRLEEHNKLVLKNSAREKQAADAERARAEEDRARTERDRKAREKKERKYEEKRKKKKQEPRFFPPRPPPSTRPDTRAALREPNAMAETAARWRSAFEVFFNSQDQPFPEPPSEKCRHIGCQKEGDRALRACKHNLASMFKSLQVNPKTERLKHHEDKFKDPKNKTKANEIFVVLQAMHENVEKEKEKEKEKKKAR